MAWHDDYTNAEIENLLTNMFNWIGEHLDDNYNWGDLNREELVEELVETYVDMGFHEDEVRSWYDWEDE